MHINHSLRFVIQSTLIGLLAAVLIILVWPDIINNGQGTGARQMMSGTDSYRKAVSATAPAVVNVYASKVLQQEVNPLFQDPLFQRFFGETRPPSGTRRNSNLGSGVIMNQGGYILTNAHVIQGMNDIQITLHDGRQADAMIIGIDTDTDLAVLRVSIDHLPTISIGNSDELQVGDVVLAIGNPYDFGQTVTQGIVSAKGRKRMGITTFEDFIQTDADINPGNSGGALITATGKLVGINTAIISNTGGSQGIGLATPINLALKVMEDLISSGRVVRGWMGIEAQILPSDIIKEAELKHGGVLVAGVLRDGPADTAGIQPGDIILELAGKPVSNPQQAIEMISEIKPGTVIDILVLRGWEEKKMTAQIATRPVFRQ